MAQMSTCQKLEFVIDEPKEVIDGTLVTLPPGCKRPIDVSILWVHVVLSVKSCGLANSIVSECVSSGLRRAANSQSSGNGRASTTSGRLAAQRRVPPLHFLRRDVLGSTRRNCSTPPNTCV
jgi:hypothetical protein